MRGWWRPQGMAAPARFHPARMSRSALLPRSRSASGLDRSPASSISVLRSWSSIRCSGTVSEAAAVPDERQVDLWLVECAQHQRIRRQPVHPGRAGRRIPAGQGRLQPPPVEHEQAVRQRGVRGKPGPGQGRAHRRALVLPDPSDAVVHRGQQVAHGPSLIDADAQRHRVDQGPDARRRRPGCCRARTTASPRGRRRRRRRSAPAAAPRRR